MSREFTQLRKFEDEYYKGMSSEVYELTELRNLGRRSFVQAGGIARKYVEGLTMLRASVDGLREAAHRVYRREYYASLYMLARGHCVAGNLTVSGNFFTAGDLAETALSVEPQVPRDIGLPDGLIADQYVAIASASLSAILSASLMDTPPVALVEGNPRAKLADEAAKRALQTCIWSENRTRMLFADGGMSDEERARVRMRHAGRAAMATGILLTPSQEAREWAAKRVCRFS